MPRTTTPANLLDSPKAISVEKEIAARGWQAVWDSVVFLYKQRLSEIEQKKGQLSDDEFTKKRFKRLSEEELLTLALCFLYQLIELGQAGTDSEEAIATLSEAETSLLEQGYPKETIAKNHHGIYLNLIREAISSGQLPLTQQNSYSFDIIKQDTGQKETIQQHYAQLYLKYDPEDYLTFRKEGKQRNNIKQDKPQPIILHKYIDKIDELLQSDSYTELAVGIAAATGRRFSEVMQRGTISIPENPTSSYEFLFSGQLKKNNAQAYLTYSLVPAQIVVDAIARFRELPKISELVGASIKKINTVTNPTVNYQVKKHFQETGIMTVLESEQAVTVQNLRGAYGAIATHFFCPTLAQFPRFLSSGLGHLIGQETINQANSSSTEHYFHYYLINANGERITEMGVKLSDLATPFPVQSQKTTLNPTEMEVGLPEAAPLQTPQTTRTIKTEETTFKPIDDQDYLRVAVDLLESQQFWAKVIGLVALTGLLPNSLLHQLIFKEIKENNIILYREQVHTLNKPLNRLVTLIDAQTVFTAIAQLRDIPEIQSLTQTKTGNEFNAYVAVEAKEHLTALGVDSFDGLLERYRSLIPSDSKKEEIEIKDNSAVVHTYASTRSEFDRLMAQLGTETQHDTLVKLLELAHIALAKGSEPEQLAFVTEKDLEIAQLKEILISKDKDINGLHKAIASHDDQLAQLQSQLTETQTIKAEQETVIVSLQSQLQEVNSELQRLSDVLQEREQAIADLQTALADAQPPEPTEPLSESAQLTQAMLTLTGVVSQLTQQLAGSKSKTQILTIPQSKKPNDSIINKNSIKRPRTQANQTLIEKAIDLVMGHNLNSPVEDRWFISYTVLSDLLGTSLTPITTFFKAYPQIAQQIDNHHKALDIDNNTHNRTYHPGAKITQFLTLPD